MQSRRDLLKRLLVAPPLLTVGGHLLAGCGGGGNDAPDTTPLETANTRQRGAYGPLAFTLDMAKLDFALGEPIEWTFTVQNVSNESIVLQGLNPVVKSWVGKLNYPYDAVISDPDTPQVINLLSRQKYSRQMRLEPSLRDDSFLQYNYKQGVFPLFTWMNVFTMDGETVPLWPGAFTGTPESEDPTVIYLSHFANVL